MFGVVTPLLMLAIDHLWFEGVSLQRVRDLGSRPLGFRVLVVFYSGVTEELLYRLFLTTFVAWSTHVAVSPFTKRARSLAQWVGVVVAAIVFGLAHVGNLPEAEHAVLRAVTINGVAGLVLGWLYWSRGLEVAILTHMVAIAVLYIAIPVLI